MANDNIVRKHTVYQRHLQSTIQKYGKNHKTYGVPVGVIVVVKTAKKYFNKIKK